MLLLIFPIAFIFLCYLSVIFRLTVSHLFGVLRNGIIDFWFFFAHKKYNECSDGELSCYVGLFAKGKTLSDVEHVVWQKYKRYNGLMVWSRERKKFVKQVIQVISNVELLDIPFTPFLGLQQIVDIAVNNAKIDIACDTQTVAIVLGDEFSVQLNSRAFKTNISPLFLNTLLTCRHFHLSIFFSAQRFMQVDALLRQVTQSVIDCNKIWRFQIHQYYDAWQLENATDTSLIKPFKRTGFFVFNKHYNAYNTLACVGALIKSVESGDMISDEEILALQTNSTIGDINVVSKPKHKLKKRLTK